MIRHVRPGTQDARIVESVYTNNGYRMPESLKGKFVIDIGANIGAFSVLCAERGAKVYAIEPHPDNFDVLQRNVAGLNVVAQQLALHSRNGWTRLHVHPENTGGHSTTTQVGDETIRVYGVRLQDILATRHCDILKLDCEGAEIHALQPLLKGLHKHVPEIVCELHMERAEQLDFEARLAPFYEGYNIFQADWRFVHRPHVSATTYSE